MPRVPAPMSRPSGPVLITAFLLAVLLAASGVAAAALTSALPPEERSPAVRQLQQAIDGLLARPGLEGAWIGVRIESLPHGDVLYDRNGELLFTPASALKLVVAAALELLGPDYRWETRVWMDPLPDAAGQGGGGGGAAGSGAGPASLPEALEGHLYLQGGGDPTLLEGDLDALAAGLRARGLRRVAGDLVLDDTFFDDVRLGAGWSWNYLDAYYAAPVSGLSVAPNPDYDANTVLVTVQPGAAAGARGRITVAPRNSHVQIVNETRTGADGSAPTIRAQRPDATDRIVVSGSIPLGSGAERRWVAVAEPALLAGNVFRHALQRAGIEVTGRTRRGQVPGRATRLLVHRSMPLAQLLHPFLKLSNNGHGEVLVKTLGRRFRGEGSWAAGNGVAASFLTDVVGIQGAFHLADGSGLSRLNLLTPAQLNALLRYMAGRPGFDAFFAALPVAGDPARLVGGTLRNRLQGSPAAGKTRAKTGSLANVSALSGYVDAADGERLIFTILVNHALGGSARELQDAVVDLLARFRRE